MTERERELQLGERSWELKEWEGKRSRERLRERALREMKLVGGMAVRAETARLTDGPERSLLILSFP